MAQQIVTSQIIVEANKGSSVETRATSVVPALTKPGNQCLTCQREVVQVWGLGAELLLEFWRINALNLQQAWVHIARVLSLAVRVDEMLAVVCVHEKRPHRETGRKPVAKHFEVEVMNLRNERVGQ